MEANDCPYDILSVPQDASAADIKKAFRKLALANHPDKQSNEEDRERATTVFAKIAAAYEILSDPEEREQYDLRKKYGGAPGTRYTTTAPGEQVPNQHQPTTTNRTTKATSGPRQNTRVRQTTDYGGSPESFKFTYDPSKVQSSDPYEIFRQVFGKDFDKEFAGSTFTVSSSPPGKTMKTVRKVVSPTIVSSTTKQSVAPSSNVAKNPRHGSCNSPTKIVRKVPVPTTVSSRGASCKNNDIGPNTIVSKSMQTQTIIHADGAKEIITTTTTIKADGSKDTTTQSSRSTSQVSSTTPTHGLRRMKTSHPKSPQGVIRTVRVYK